MEKTGTKEQLLTLFENNKGKFFSGEEIAEKLDISRTAVWKAVQSLRNEGYNIEAVRNRGYCLSPDTDILSNQGIKKYLKPQCDFMKLEVVQTVDSTNNLARERAVGGVFDGYTVVAGNQTKGKGRMGRSFHSPADTGIYMSVVLRPDNFTPQQAVKLTTMAAVAVCEAIEDVSGEKAEIKWVNDVFVRGRKVCGILTEASFGLEDGMLEYAILGVGINVFAPAEGFPDEIKNIAGAVFDQPKSDCKNRLAAEFLNHFMAYYCGCSGGHQDIDSQDTGSKDTGEYRHIDEYRRRSMVIGKEIRVITPKTTRNARALDVDRDCQLIVEYEDGSTESLFSGEISIRLPNAPDPVFASRPDFAGDSEASGSPASASLSKLTEEIISGRRLNRSDDMKILLKADLRQLCAGADEIRRRLCGDKADLCTIINGLSGRCSEDCRFCAQSCHYHTEAEEYPFLEPEEIMTDARRNEAAGINRYSIVTAGRSLKGDALEKALIAYEKLHRETGLRLCASHGIQTLEEFRRMKAAGVERCHCNIETSRRYFPEVCTTHTYDDKIDNIRRAQEAGLDVCSGGIIGMGENWEDRIDMAVSLAELGIGSIPINVLRPIPGTPFEGMPAITDEEVLRTVAIFRYINPAAWIRMAAGRGQFPDGGYELFQSGANAAITGDMLTTTGTGMADDIKMFRKMGYEL